MILPIPQPLAADVTPTQLHKISDRPAVSYGLTHGAGGHVAAAVEGFGHIVSGGLTDKIGDAFDSQAMCNYKNDKLAYGTGEALGAATLLATGVGAADVGAADGITELAPDAVRFSQSSVNDVGEIADSMSEAGWQGAPVDVVRMEDGGLTSVDNSRLLAAKQTGTNLLARVHDAGDAFDPAVEGADRSSALGNPNTWGEAVLNRIAGQNAGYRGTYPLGSPFTGWNGS